MYIEKIELCGFRSFRKGTIAELSPRQNVVVGPNGSGKSSIVTALEFVLTRNYARLNSHHRNELICNVVNGNQRSTGASVTVWLDNSDECFPINEHKVAIKRVLSAKTDEYFVNDRKKSFDELAVMLESAGFSPNNSHFLVRQGFVTEIAFGSPKDLLNILRGISGATTFEEKKAKAMKVIQDCDLRIKRYEAQIHSTKEQFELFNIDREKVQEFQKQAKIRRFLAGRIARLKYDAARKQMDDLKAEHQGLVGNLVEEEKELDNDSQALQEIRKNIEDVNASVRKAKDERKVNIQMIQQHETVINALQEEIAELEELSQSNDLEKAKREERKQIQDELASLNHRIATNGTSQEAVQLQIDQLEAKMKNVIELIELNKMDNQIARRAQIEKRVHRLDEEKGELSKLLKICEEQQQKNNEIKLSQDDIDKMGRDIVKKSEKLCALKSMKNNLEFERREIIASNGGMQKNALELETKLKNVSSNLNVFSNNMAVGSREVMQKLIELCTEKIANDSLGDVQSALLQSIVDGYYGQFVDCVRLDQELTPEIRRAVYKPIEALLKNRIFHHIVANQQVANDILKLLNQLQDEQGWTIEGSFKFIVLNQLPASPADADDILNDENTIQPLISYFESIKPEAEKGIEYLCRGLYICDSFQRCANLRNLNRPFDFSTLNGDKINRYGVISFTPDHEMTKYEHFELYNQLSLELADSKQKLADLNEAYAKKSEDIAQCEEQIGVLEDEIAQMTEKLRNANKYEQRRKHEKKVEDQEAKISSIKAKIVCTEEEIFFWTNELSNPTDASKIEEISGADLAEINKQKHKLSSLKKEQGDDCFQKQQLATKMSLLEKQINDLFAKRIKHTNADATKKKLSEQLEEYERKYEEMVQKSKQIDQKISQLLNESSTLKKELAELEDSFKKKERQVFEHREKVKSFDGKMKELNSRVISFRSDAENYGAYRNHTEGGQLAKYARMGQDALNQNLRRINEKINQITQGQLTEEIVKRYDEMETSLEEMERQLDRSAKNVLSIRELIDAIEAKKQEIIERTYKQVNQNLQEIFRKLVPGGTVRLQFIGNDQHQVAKRARASTGRSRDVLNDSYQSSLGELSSVNTQSTQTSAGSSSLDLARKVMTTLPTEEKFIGLEILVSFTGSGKLSNVMSLSGGQRAMVSLAFIFALQKVDPTPFYIFDEVDANLDEEKREAVAKLIKHASESDGKQFIITTFHQQTAGNGDKFFGVTNKNRLSNVTAIDREVALDFIEQGFLGRRHTDPVNEEEEVAGGGGDATAGAENTEGDLHSTVGPFQVSGANTTAPPEDGDDVHSMMSMEL